MQDCQLLGYDAVENRDMRIRRMRFAPGNAGKKSQRKIRYFGKKMKSREKTTRTSYLYANIPQNKCCSPIDLSISGDDRSRSPLGQLSSSNQSPGDQNRAAGFFEALGLGSLWFLWCQMRAFGHDHAVRFTSGGSSCI